MIGCHTHRPHTGLSNFSLSLVSATFSVLTFSVVSLPHTGWAISTVRTELGHGVLMCAGGAEAVCVDRKNKFPIFGNAAGHQLIMYVSLL